MTLEWEWHSHLERYIHDEIEPDFVQLVTWVRDEARENAPEKSGKLKRSIEITWLGRFSVLIGSDLPYARIHEKGGQINNGRTIYPRVKKALANVETGWGPYARVYNPGYIKAKHYLEHAVNRIPDFLRLLR